MFDAMKCSLSSQHRAAITILLLHGLVYGVLLGTDSFVSSFYLFYSSQASLSIVGSESLSCVLLVIELFMLPVGGWLADVYYGRYRVLIASVWGMWTAMMIITGNSTILYLFSDVQPVRIAVLYLTYPVSLLAMAILRAFFQANILAFLLDNLHSESSDTIRKYIYFFVWTMIVSTRFTIEFMPCVSTEPLISNLLQQVTMAGAMTAAVCVILCFGNYFNVAFRPKNPLKLIRNVISYSVKNKYPRHRSAFTYCENTIPSRMDLAMSKYGGPFDEEEVNDVKTFGKLLLTMPAFAFGCVMYFGITYSVSSISNTSCINRYPLLITYFAVIGIGIPLFLLLQQSSLLRRLNSLHYMVFGYFIMNLSAIVTLVLFLLKDITRFQTIAIAVSGIAFTIMFPSTNELFCSQAPHQMRGILIGFAYSTQTIARIILLIILSVLRILFEDNTIKRLNIFAITMAIIGFVGFVLFVIFAKIYKFRKRTQTDDVYRYIEEYYDNVIANYPTDEPAPADSGEPYQQYDNMYNVH